MKQIFECETELGRCDADRVNGHFGEGPAGWMAFVHTTAAMTGSKGIVRIEQRCYLRSTEFDNELRPQNWVKPEIALEPVFGSTEDTTRMVRELHERYVEKARGEFVEQSLMLVSGPFCGA